MAGLKVSFNGIERVKKRLAKQPALQGEALRVFLIEEAGRGMNVAQTRVPVITGRLRSSAFIRGGKTKATETQIEYGYDAPYASYVHERPQGRGYKWMERAFQEALKGFHKRVAEAIARALDEKKPKGAKPPPLDTAPPVVAPKKKRKTKLQRKLAAAKKKLAKAKKQFAKKVRTARKAGKKRLNAARRKSRRATKRGMRAAKRHARGAFRSGRRAGKGAFRAGRKAGKGAFRAGKKARKFAMRRQRSLNKIRARAAKRKAAMKHKRAHKLFSDLRRGARRSMGTAMNVKALIDKFRSKGDK